MKLYVSGRVFSHLESSTPHSLMLFLCSSLQGVLQYLTLTSHCPHFAGCPTPSTTHSPLTVFSSLKSNLFLCCRVSYIIYLTDPDEPWTQEDGGSLELYPLVEGVCVCVLELYPLVEGVCVCA